MGILFRSRSVALACAGVLSVIAVCAGCGSGGGGGSKSDVASVTTFVMFEQVAPKAAPETVSAANGDVDPADMESFTFTVTEISLDYEGETDNEGEGEGEGEGDASKVVVFSGETDIDLMDIVGVSALISSGDVPAGKYTKIRMSIANPRLVLKSDPLTEITDIQLTANDNLFVSEQFVVEEEMSVLVLLVFEDLHLVETGQGRYVLTPQLRAEVDIENAEAVMSGTITDVDLVAWNITVKQGDTEVVMDLGDAEIYLSTDIDIPTGTELSLVKDLNVVVSGTYWVDGLFTADTIEILAD